MRETLEFIIAEFRGSWRFRWRAVVAAWFVCLIGWTVVYMIPDNYESEATVLFDTTSDLRKLLDNLTVSSDFLSQVETVQTALLGRQQLEKVAKETDLYLRASNQQEMENLIAQLRTNISISSDQQRRANTYKIGYRDPEPQIAFEVVNSLLNSMVEQSLGANREGTQRAQEFLRSQVEELEKQLTESELRLADFKRKNVGRMPGEGGDYFARLSGEMAALEDTRTKLRQANRRKDTLQSQLAGNGSANDTAAQPSELDLRIAENQRKLEALQLRFTSQHPDVVSLEATLAQLEEQKKRQLAALKGMDMSSAASTNPVLQNIQIELAKVNVEIASLAEQEQTHQRKISELRELVDVLPQIEADLARLNRDYDVNQAQYSALLQRLEVAELSESAGQSGDLKIQVINPPMVPIRPAAPNRPFLISVVLLLGLGVGGGVAFLGNQLKPVFTSPNILREATGFPILGTVQVMLTREVKRRRRGQFGVFGGAIAVLCIVFAFAVLFQEPVSKLVRTFIQGI
jgi:polysaccharide chain length determinant protein (PEP-CTERM system associated)